MTIARFYSTEQLSPRQMLLPSGTLWARDAAIARTGLQSYHVSELPELADSIATDSDGMFDVLRDEAEVFDERSMASFEGAPITLGHPAEAVTPENWKALAVGHVANVRRSDDVLLADLLISDHRGIHAVRDLGWRGLSAGYEAQYQPSDAGGLRQVGIVANHVALLGPHEEARCGPICAIGDSAPKKGKPMNALGMTDEQFDVVLAKLKRRGGVSRKFARNPSQKKPGTTTDDRAAFMRTLQARDQANRATLTDMNKRNAEFWRRASS